MPLVKIDSYAHCGPAHHDAQASINGAAINGAAAVVIFSRRASAQVLRPPPHAVAVPLSSPLFLMVTVFLGVPDGLPWPSTLYTTSMPSSTAQPRQPNWVTAERHQICSSNQLHFKAVGVTMTMTMTRL